MATAPLNTQAQSADTETNLSTDSLQNAAWEVLDDEKQWRLFSQTINQADGSTLVESQFLLDGLHCAACSGIIEHGLKSEQGIQRARVSMSKNRGVITWSPAQTKPSQILQRIHDLGYQAAPATMLGEHTKVQDNKRKAFWRWMVAGFCAMQVMMYAAPGYFSEPGSITPEMINLLRWASWLLSLPVLLFSSQPFFRNAWFDFKHLRVSMDLPLAIGITITFTLSSMATFFPEGWWGGEVYFDSMTMLVFFLLSARLIEARLHSKTMGALETLLNRIPENTTLVKPDGSLVRILNQNLTAGDIVQVEKGEAFPADGVITQGDTQADEALLTGESTAINKPCNSQVIAGSYNLGQTIQMRVEKTGNATRYGEIMQLIEKAAIEKPRLSKLADTIAKPFLIAVLGSAIIAGLLLWSQDPAKALVTAATVLIVTCPCALSLATPAAMLASASALIKRGVLIKNLQALEDLTNVDTVIFDKTGTLTEHNINISHIDTKDKLPSNTALRLAKALAQSSTHPVAQAISQHPLDEATQQNLPAMQAITEYTGQGMTGKLSETADVNKEIKGLIKLGSANFCGHSPNEEQAVYLADENGWLATFYLTEQLKTNAKTTLDWLQTHHYRCELLSGDQSPAVAQTAKALQFDTYQSACEPADKLARLEALKANGSKVLMVGDGLNDGPILASAHVSIAMGQGVALTQAHADVILTNGDIGLVATSLQQAKRTMQVIKQNMTWAVLYNAICIPLAFIGWLTPWQAGLGMAISSLVVILNAVRLARMGSQTNLGETV